MKLAFTRSNEQCKPCPRVSLVTGGSAGAQDVYSYQAVISGEMVKKICVRIKLRLLRTIQMSLRQCMESLDSVNWLAIKMPDSDWT